MDDKWTYDELKAAVLAYVEMRELEASGQPFTKKQYYRDLAGKFGRTEKSFEYRMQNISYVYSLMGRAWNSGLKPAKNVGANTAKEIERIICEVEGRENQQVATFEAQVSKHRSQKSLGKPLGTKQPKQYQSSVSSYQRDPVVKAWVLRNANGQCESCGNAAPFINWAGEPFLEVHHLRQLADGGSDRVTNTVALCPNCHRALHYAQDKPVLLDALYAKTPRLIRE
ncbi:HNH endonuclease [Ferrimonas sediminicola]|uniref:HNH endonuclease n=1 Tax=Ferrimonas sediminicola TaxID=2569538 RepID=A0A4U1BJI6_9GAMM|nr:HNH endonuclease signature motif containing protein [Ferrimonas sediminicola]TKB51352.1 HNH endonuclease [Ferrimonas sediminicola]